MDIKTKLRLLRTGELRVTQNVKDFLKKIKEEDKKINAFLDIREELSLKRAEYLDKNREKLKNKKLFGLCVAVKASINVKNYNISCGSKTLENYIGAYNATVVDKIENEGAVVIGITNCDEFCCGSSGETSAFGPTRNPCCSERIPGGSSSGSAAAVTAGFCDLALGSDTGGSIRNPASHCGCVGIKPSYGLVSRYGLIDLSMSLDQIGSLARDVYGAALLLSVIAGYDENDSTTFSEKLLPYHEMLNLQGYMTIGISPQLNELTDRNINEKITELLEKLKRNYNFKVKEVSLKHVKLAVQAYYPICYVEFFSATRRFTGRAYGKKIEDVAGPEVLRRILGGSEISKEEYHGLYYRRALKAMQLIKQDFSKAFNECDVIISATVPRLPHRIGSKIKVEEMYSYDALTIPANLGGIPAVSVPISYISNCPVGLQIFAPAFAEARMLQVAKAVEDIR
jgi:aspartyl-tRNA(Asn)/glutamyl-tRNA(Gln) amidotransferase subunit A